MGSGQGAIEYHQAPHGVTFAQAATVLQDTLVLTVFDSAHSEAEERWFTLVYAGLRWFTLVYAGLR
ncbi:MAG: BrnT family toxin, partial [Rhodoferax sp.]|nr:BrnT family toxin [Rhodoferax sp.]